MSKKTRKAVAPGLQAWIEARNRHCLSHAHVQMARELGLNPNKLGSIDNHEQEPWKAPLPQFIEPLSREVRAGSVPRRSCRSSSERDRWRRRRRSARQRGRRAEAVGDGPS